MRTCIVAVILLFGSATIAAADAPAVYLWYEPEWFPGVEGSFAYWTGQTKPMGTWGIAGPGISPEWSQGGESEWNSMGAAAEETKAICHRELVVPSAGKYRLWVRYVDHRRKTEPFTVSVEQAGKPAIAGELGMVPVVSAGDEFALYWGFSFGWGSLEGELAAGNAKLSFAIDKQGEGWRQIDAVLLTDDLDYTPGGREKPRFTYQDEFDLQPADSAGWRGRPADLPLGAAWQRPPLAGNDFSMWTQVEAEPKWWGAQSLDTVKPFDVFFQFSPPYDIREQFQKQFAGRRDLPIMAWPRLVPGLYLGATPELGAESPVRKWLELTKTPFYLLTNYANPQYTDQTGPATYQALSGPLAEQFLGYIHGEALGTSGVGPSPGKLGVTRREHVDAMGRELVAKQTEAWSKIYKTGVTADHFAKGISCLSVHSITLAHLFHELGARTVGYELDSTNIHVPMRIAFERGAARQYGGAWINYASGNFGDACNYFSQNPVVPRGAPGWFHSKYAITDGVTATWYRKLYYLNYLSGASAVFWEQGLANQWILPGPGTHPIGLSPFGRATEDFQSFADRLPERGEPLAPVGLLLSYGHAYDRVSYECKMLGFGEDRADLELRELFNVCWHPAAVVEGMPAAPDVQSMPGGVYGNIFDVLVDRPARAKAIFDYPVVWAAGDVELGGAWLGVLEDYLRRGGTLVVNIEAAKQLPPALLGLRPTGRTTLADTWRPQHGAARAAVPFEVSEVEIGSFAGDDGVAGKKARPLAFAGADLPLVTRHEVGAGAVIVGLVPRWIGLDERAHPVLPYLMNGVTAGLLPIEVRRADGGPLRGEVMYQVNRTKDGYLVLLINNRGVDKTPSGIARVDRRAYADVVVRTTMAVKVATEYTAPGDLAPVAVNGTSEIPLRIPPGDVQVVHLVTE